MKKILFLLIFAHNLLGYSEAHSPYANIHFMGGVPMIGMGAQTKSGIHAFDCSASICPISLKVFHLRTLYLIYPKQTGCYFGGGLGLLNELETLEISGSCEGALGYHWSNGIFLEGNVIVPFKQSQHIAPVWPGLTLGFGF